MYEITLTRGRTLNKKIRILSGGVPYIPGADEKIRFGVKKYYAQKDYIIRKEYGPADVVNGVITLRLDPEDTAHLPLQSYAYDIGLQRGAEYYDIIKASSIVLTGNVTAWEGQDG